MSEIKLSDFPKLTSVSGNLYIPIIRENDDKTFTNYIIKANGLVELYENFDSSNYYTKDLIDTTISNNKSYLVTVYKSSEELPLISGGSYNFISGDITPPTGWSTSSTNLSTPIWISYRLFKSNNDTSSWSTPTRIITSSEEILLDILPTYSATVTLYKNSNTQPVTPTGGTFDFTLVNNVYKGLTSIPYGWSLTNDELNDPIWVTTCSFNSDGSSTGWSTPFKYIDIDSILENAKTESASLVTQALNNATSNLQTVLTSLQELIAESNDLLTQALKDLNTAQKTISSVVGTLSNLSSSVDTLNGQLITLGNTIDSITSTINSVSNVVDSLTATITNLVSSVNTLSGTVNVVQSKLDGINSSITNIATSVDANNDVVNTVSLELNAVKGTIELCVTKTELDTASQSILSLASDYIEASVSTAKTNLLNLIDVVKSALVSVTSDSIKALVAEALTDNETVKTKVTEIILDSDSITTAVAQEVNDKVTSATIILKITTGDNGELSSAILLTADNITLNGLTIIDKLVTKDIDIDGLTHIYGSDSLKAGGNTLMVLGVGTDGISTFNADGSGSLAKGLISWSKDSGTQTWGLSVRGNIDALSGTIGGWTIGNNYLYSSSGNNSLQMHPSNGLQSINTSNSTINWALNSDGSGQLGSGFKWDTSGNVTFSGTVNADLLRVGGTAANKSNSLFKVNSDGSITADSLSVKTINGKDVSSMFTSANTIAGGTIGGWKIDSTSLLNIIYTYKDSDGGLKTSNSVFTDSELNDFLDDPDNPDLTYELYYKGLVLNKEYLRFVDAYDGGTTSPGGHGHWIDVNIKGILGFASSLNAPDYSTPEDTTFKLGINGDGFVASNNFSWDTLGNIFIGQNTSGSYEYNDNKYYSKISNDGTLYTSQIEAIGGTIGGWTIDTKGIKNVQEPTTYVNDTTGENIKVTISDVGFVLSLDYDLLQNVLQVKNVQTNVDGSIDGAGKITIGDLGLRIEVLKSDVSSEDYTQMAFLSILGAGSLAYGNISWTSDGAVTIKNTTSDIRLKNIVKNDSCLSLDAFANAPYFLFKWNNLTQLDLTETHVGTSAQYWQDICPDIVWTNERSGYLGLDYDILAFGGVVTLAKEIKSLKEKISELEAKLAE